MDDYMDFGIDPSSIDYTTADISNADIANSIDGLDWTPETMANWGDDVQGFGGDAGALGQAHRSTEGSPNVRSPSESELRPLTQGSSLGKTFGSKISSLFEDKKGDLDVNKLLKFGLGLGSFVNSLGKGKNASQSNQLQQQLAQQMRSTWTPQQSMWAQYFQTPTNFARPQVSAAAMPSPIVASRGYAEGGDVELPQGMPQDMGGGDAGGVFSGFVTGQGGGQSDVVQANLSPGEYVLDADVVAAIGDGSNEEGARILDQWREQLRSMKRDAPPSDIPPSMSDGGMQLPMPGEGEQ